ncbi:type III polyketide synthase [Cohnella caldifontis]|uniref:type III polyketide synthase n=1 Tax=Cohnella caldifontis TaxID=3027471 RepID=UPI0023EE1EBB|nr:type III polyketide synthase [Cohnella sp. YIM B05605]
MEHPSILGIGTAVPAYLLDQEDTLARISGALRDRPDAARWAKRIFARCGVDTRYTCEPNLLEPAERCRYVSSAGGPPIATTEERMAAYRKEAARLAAEAARKALADGRIRPGDVTHLFAVTCTGFFLPGLDAELAWELDLPADVERFPLTFQGCAAGMTALRMSEAVVRGRPDAKALIVAVELCTLHIQPSLDKEELYSASFFGDGASACVVGRASAERPGAFALREARAVPFPGTRDRMRWSVGNHGFRLHLSSEIPELIGRFVPPAFEEFWGGRERPELWAIHPGGKGIVDALQAAFRLSDEQTADSRSVLRRFGNMSSATILFVLNGLRERLRGGGAGEKAGFAAAFGPGMTAEFLRFDYRPS